MKYSPGIMFGLPGIAGSGIVPPIVSGSGREP